MSNYGTLAIWRSTIDYVPGGRTCSRQIFCGTHPIVRYRTDNDLPDWLEVECAKTPMSPIRAALPKAFGQISAVGVPSIEPPSFSAIVDLVQNEALETRPNTPRNDLLIRALLIAAIALVVGLLGWSYATGGIFHVLLRSGPAEAK